MCRWSGFRRLYRNRLYRSPSGIGVNRVTHRPGRLDHALLNLAGHLARIAINRAHEIETGLMLLCKLADQPFKSPERTDIEAAKLRNKVDVGAAPRRM